MNGSEKLTITDEYIKLEDDSLPDVAKWIMHIGEKDLMEEQAKIVCSNGGDILEVGFGMHLMADFIQTHDIKSHTIIELHPEIYARALEWKKGKKNTEILLGDWYDVIPKMNQKFDGISHDTYQGSDKNMIYFLDYVKPLCKVGTIVVFYFYSFELNGGADGTIEGNKNVKPNHESYLVGTKTPLKKVFNRKDVFLKDYKTIPFRTLFPNGRTDEGEYSLYYTYFDGENFVKSLNENVDSDIQYAIEDIEMQKKFSKISWI